MCKSVKKLNFLHAFYIYVIPFLYFCAAKHLYNIVFQETKQLSYSESILFNLIFMFRRTIPCDEQRRTGNIAISHQ